MMIKNIKNRKKIYTKMNYLIYTALLTQTGTNDPVLTILDNTIGNIVWQRTGVGLFIGTLPGAFQSGKTFPTISNSTSPSYQYSFGQDSYPDSVGIITARNEVAEDGLLYETPIEIRVYP